MFPLSIVEEVGRMVGKEEVGWILFEYIPEQEELIVSVPTFSLRSRLSQDITYPSPFPK
jgi:hypothetical protein